MQARMDDNPLMLFGLSDLQRAMLLMALADSQASEADQFEELIWSDGQRLPDQIGETDIWSEVVGEASEASSSLDQPAGEGAAIARPEEAESRGAVTVMLRNLPNRAKTDRVREHVVAIGFPDVVKVSLPTDRKTGCNKGYAFLEFPDKRMALDFITQVSETQLAGSESPKRLEANLSKRQGKSAPRHPSSGSSVFANWSPLSAGQAVHVM